MMESSDTNIAPLLLRNLIISIFMFVDKILLNLAENYKFLHFFRKLLISSFFFLLRFLLSFFPSLNLPLFDHNYAFNPSKGGNYVPTTIHGGGSGGSGGSGGDSGIARALSQLLSVVNEVPVSSRKYDVVRSLTDRLIDENLREGSEPLLEINRTVLTSAFSRTLGQLESAVTDQQCKAGNNGIEVSNETRVVHYYILKRVLWAVQYFGDVVWTRFGKSWEELSRPGSSAEKLAAELLWLARKMAACGNGEEAVCRWASASSLGWLGLSAEPPLQGSLVKVSAFLFKQAQDMGGDEVEERVKEQQRQTKMKMLMSWLPLLCRASNGTDAQVLSISERAELETVLEETIETLEEEEQEKVLSLWLHHFTGCSSSDWPNLHACYARWCTASRRLLLLQ
ncbi:uncharacterized protein LOC132300306 [Cornus florida]|uniref:uncharacterized protein LOC132300306 n=1 Tax=Cornus florida TaxID=4283 RepID=UPI0028A27A9C|nr:uncharacterized protein LOC132300306 [Cornus florida]